MRRSVIALVLAVLATLPSHRLVPGFQELAAQQPTSDPTTPSLLHGLRWREIGPANMGGRTVDIAGIPGDASTVYMATASGGLWRTTDGGTTWSSIFEDGGTLSLGAVAVAPSDPNVVYVGTGENNPRNSSSMGDGVYRSTDGGDSWTHLGLEDTQKIGRIRVHPGNPDLVYVATLGHTWGPNPERGVFRSRNGGRTWEKVLYVNQTTGAADLAMDPSNPRILYAGMWDHLRKPWHFRSGGEGSGLYRSADGGDSWTLLTDPALDNGLPTDTLGRMGVAVAASDPDVVYALIESDEGVLWRSDDGGASWRMVSDDRRVKSRPFYYADIRVDPTDEHTLYAVSGALLRSIDGGRSWERLASNIHGDHQALWIDPADPDRLVNGNDGGFHFSFDGGESWELMNTAALGQFYHVETDNRWPYRVCGGLQDNDVWCGPSRTWNVTGALIHDWYEIAGPGDGMYVQIDPRDPDVIWTNTQNGSVERVDLRTGEGRHIDPHPLAGGGQPAGARDVRFNWNAPLHMSPHDPDVVFLGANVLFRTDDGGQSWERMSPDLSRGDTTKLGPSGGVTPDNTGAEHHGTITSVAQSPVDARVVWAGTDDGNVQITRDRGETWSNVAGNVPGLPQESWVSHVEASRAEVGRAYLAVDRHRSDDPSPRIYRTDDFGESWTEIGASLPPLHWVHVVREDPRNPDVLYAGTELGIWLSTDGGGSWRSLRLNLPPVAVRDLTVHPRDNDLVIATHGRSLWVLDDVAVLQELAWTGRPDGDAEGTDDGGASPTDALVTPRAAVRFLPWARRFRFDIGDRIFVGENPPYGAILTWSLSEETAAALAESGGGPEGGGRGQGRRAGGDTATVTLRILDHAGEEVRSLEGPARAGLNRTAWDLRHGTDADEEDGGDSPFRRGPQGPLVVPGAFTVALELPADTLTVPLEVILDPRHQVPVMDLVAQRDALLEILAMDRRITRTAQELQDAREQMGRVAERLGEDRETLAGELEALSDSVAEVRTGLVGDEDDEDYDTREDVRGDLRSVARQMEGATARPTDAQLEWKERLILRGEALLATAETMLGPRLEALNRRLEEEGVPRVGRESR